MASASRGVIAGVFEVVVVAGVVCCNMGHGPFGHKNSPDMGEYRAGLMNNNRLVRVSGSSVQCSSVEKSRFFLRGTRLTRRRMERKVEQLRFDRAAQLALWIKHLKRALLRNFLDQPCEQPQGLSDGFR